MEYEASAAQLIANRLNAQKSTGPRTEEGKANARFNARRHGLTGQFYCMSEEDEQAYKSFEADLLQDLKPSGPYETQLAISITQDQWRLNRSRSVEFNLYGKGHDRFADDTDAPTANMQAASTMADTYRADDRVFANIALYETRIHRMIAKNRKELNDLRAAREQREAAIRKEAQMLVQLADLIGATLLDVGLLPATAARIFCIHVMTHRPALSPPTLCGDQSLWPMASFFPSPERAPSSSVNSASASPPNAQKRAGTARKSVSMPYRSF